MKHAVSLLTSRVAVVFSHLFIYYLLIIIINNSNNTYATYNKNLVVHGRDKLA